MKELVPAVVFVLVLTFNVNAQIQKTSDNSDVKALVQKGLAFYKAKDFRAAAEAFARAVELDPSLFVAQNNLGFAQLGLEDFEAAGEVFKKALAIEPKSIDSLGGLCVAYARQKQSQEAVATCGEVHAMKPTFSSAYYQAWGYLDLQKYPEAIELLKECERLDPGESVTYIALAEAYSHLKRFDDALTYAQKAAQSNPVAQNAYVALGAIYFEMNKLKDAKQLFGKAVSLQPESAPIRYNLAMTCLALKQKDCAREQYAIIKTEEPVLSTRLLDQIYSSRVVQVGSH